jgi:hypothetical protein
MDFELFLSVLAKIRTMIGKSITLTREDVASGDTFLIFSAYDSHTITFKRRYDGVIVLLFDNDDSILLEDCPDSFLRTLIKNL